MNKEYIEKIIKEYLEHSRRYAWQPGVTNKERIDIFLRSERVKNLTIPIVSGSFTDEKIQEIAYKIKDKRINDSPELDNWIQERMVECAIEMADYVLNDR